MEKCAEPFFELVLLGVCPLGHVKQLIHSTFCTKAECLEYAFSCTKPFPADLVVTSFELPSSLREPAGEADGVAELLQPHPGGNS